MKATDACAVTLDGCWYYSAQFNDWTYVFTAIDGSFLIMDEWGNEHKHRSPLLIEALSPVKVNGTSPENYIERLEYARAEAGWMF